MTIQGKAAKAGALVAKFQSLHVFYPDAKSDDDMLFNGTATSSDWKIDEFVSAKVGRCKLHVSEPVLKAPMVSALAAII